MNTIALAEDALLLDKALKSLSNQAGFAIAFGGLATQDGTPLSAFIGTRRHTLDGLLIEPTEGLGGRALVERKPVAAVQYGESDAITHRYDRQILAEEIVSLIAVPVIVDGTVRALIYGGQHQETEFGDVATHKAVKVAEALAWEYSVHDEVERRLALIETQRQRTLSADVLEDLRMLYAEIRELGRGATDPDTVRRLETARVALENSGGANSDFSADPLFGAGSKLSPATALSPREIDVVANVALGKRNAQIALQLGLTESTVKSYLSSVMTKLDAKSRYAAVIAARQLRLIP